MRRSGKGLFILLAVAMLVAVAGPAVFSASKQYTVGVVLPYEAGWFGFFKQAYEMVAKEQGFKVTFQFHQYNPSNETTAVQNLITMGVDAINLTAATPESAQFSCKLANDAKIPIQITESGLAAGPGKPFADIDFNWYDVYKYTVNKLRRDVSGPISLVYISGIAGSPTIVQGIKGLTDEMKNVKDFKLATDIQYGDYATDKSLNIMKNIIQSGVKFNAALGGCAEITEGIIQAMREMKVDMNKVAVVSINGAPMDVENFKKGYLDFALSQSPTLHGMICAYNLIAYLKGEKYQKKTYSPIVWVSAKTYQNALIPWEMGESWLPVAKDFVKTGVYHPNLRK